MKSMSFSKEQVLRVTIPVFAVLILLIGAFFIFRYQRHNSQPVEQFSVNKTELSSTQTPSAIPTNLPVEAGSKVLQNYEAKTTDGRIQSTKKLTSKKDPKTALEFYSDFFKKQGWTGGFSPSASTAGGQQVAVFKKVQDIMTIIATPAISGSSVVEISITQSISQ